MCSLFTYFIVGLLSSIIPIFIIYLFIRENAGAEFDTIKYYPILYALFTMVLLYAIEVIYPDMNMFVVGALAGLFLTSFDRFVTKVPTLIGVTPATYQLSMIVVWSLWYGFVIKNLF